MSWMQIYNEVANDRTGNYFLQFPRMIQDMLRTHTQYRESPHFNRLQRPMLRVYGGSPYSMEDVYNGLLFLYEHDIKSFILLEDSTYTLRLICTLLDLNETKSKFTVSINESYVTTIADCWNQPVGISGVIINMNGRKVRHNQALPSNVIS